MPSVSERSVDEWTYVEPVPRVMARYVDWLKTLPIEWFGNVEHTHKAIDDAVGFANLLVELSRRVGT